MTGRPDAVLAYVRDLLFSSRIGETARRLGLPFRAVRSLGDLESALGDRPALILVDLTATGPDTAAALDAIDRAGRPAAVLGWTTHVLWKATRPLHERCDLVVTREALTEKLPDLLRDHVRVSREPERTGADGSSSSTTTG